MISPWFRYFVGLAILISGIPAHVFGCTCVDWSAERPCNLMKNPAEVMFVGHSSQRRTLPSRGRNQRGKLVTHSE